MSIIRMIKKNYVTSTSASTITIRWTMVNSVAQYVTDISDVRYCSLDVPSPQHPQNADRESEAQAHFEQAHARH